MELGAKIWVSWTTPSSHLPGGLHGTRCPLTDMPDCFRCSSGQEETALQAFSYCELIRPFRSHIREYTASISPKQLVLPDVGYVVDNVDPSYRGEKRVVFHAILSIGRMVIWTTRKMGLYKGVNFSHRDLILFFRHHLRVTIGCDRKCLDHITFDNRWV